MTIKLQDGNIAIIEAGMRLRSFNPELWAEFVRAVDTYATAHRDAMLRAPPDALVDARGQAQALMLFHGKLATIEQAYQEILNQHKKGNKP